jgi:hypothetical protein
MLRAENHDSICASVMAQTFIEPALSCATSRSMSARMSPLPHDENTAVRRCCRGCGARSGTAQA